MCVRNGAVLVIFAIAAINYRPEMLTDNTCDTSTSADRPAEILITVYLDGSPGRYQAYLGGQQELLCVSRQPFLDSARKLLARGHDRRTMLIMRWAGAKEWALRGPLGVAARLTVDEHNGTFAKWKPYSRSAVPPKIAKSASQAPECRTAEKAAPDGTAEKASIEPAGQHTALHLNSLSNGGSPAAWREQALASTAATSTIPAPTKEAI
jgi:hypothetical protein